MSNDLLADFIQDPQPDELVRAVYHDGKERLIPFRLLENSPWYWDDITDMRDLPLRSFMAGKEKSDSPDLFPELKVDP